MVDYFVSKCAESDKFVKNIIGTDNSNLYVTDKTHVRCMGLKDTEREREREREREVVWGRVG